MLSTSGETLEKVMTEFQENIPEAFNRSFQIGSPKLKQSDAMVRKKATSLDSIVPLT
jgi:hypothetical protein